MCANMFNGMLLENKSVKRSQKQNRIKKQEKKGAMSKEEI